MERVILWKNAEGLINLLKILDFCGTMRYNRYGMMIEYKKQ